MPWVDGPNGREYKCSLYCKEELPTWDELYNEFYLGKVFDYDPKDISHQTLDPYWKRPRRKMLLSWACNQLNKMIFDDKIDPIPFIRKDLGYEAEWIKFVLLQRSEYLHNYKYTVRTPTVPPVIYNCKIPHNNEYSIFTTDHPRKDIDDLTDYFELVALINGSRPVVKTDGYMYTIITFILNDVILYFKNGVGWKDEAGNIIPSDPMNHGCVGVGYDPAL